MNAELLELPDSDAKSIAQFKIRFHQLIDECKDHKVTNQLTADEAVHKIRKLDDFAKEAYSQSKKLCSPFKAVVDFISGQFTSMEDEPKLISKRLRNDISVLHAKKEQERIEAQRKLDAEAKKKADKEKARLEQKAMEAAGRGDFDKAQELSVKAEEIVPEARIAVKSVEASQGSAMTTRWKFGIVDETLVPREFLMPDEKSLQKYATTAKEKASVPGVRFYPETTPTIRRN